MILKYKELSVLIMLSHSEDEIARMSEKFPQDFPLIFSNFSIDIVENIEGTVSVTLPDKALSEDQVSAAIHMFESEYSKVKEKSDGQFEIDGTNITKKVILPGRTIIINKPEYVIVLIKDKTPVEMRIEE